MKRFRTISELLHEAGLWPDAEGRVRATMKGRGVNKLEITHDATKADGIILTRVVKGPPVIPSSIVPCEQCGQKCWFGLDSEMALGGRRIRMICTECVGPTS